MKLIMVVMLWTMVPLINNDIIMQIYVRRLTGIMYSEVLLIKQHQAIEDSP